MKNRNILFLIGLFFLLSNGLFAQKEVKFEIRHWLGNNPFAFNLASQNNMGSDFNVTRLEYYLSQIAIVHDTGKVTLVPETWLLINPSQPTLVDLGSFDIDQVEAIRFYVGIDTAHNHDDPALYPITHPLGPKSPSMHWGWAAGYRFVAIEGKSGAGMSYDYQLHGLGDNNYFQTEVLAPMLTPFTGGVVISLDADYTQVVQGMNLNSGLIVHGDNKEARQALLNMKIHVFKPAGANTAIEDEFQAPAFQLYPNPAEAGFSTLLLDEANTGYEVRVSDLLGRTVFSTEVKAGERKIIISTNEAGLYMLSLVKDGKVWGSRKWMVK